MKNDIPVKRGSGNVFADLGLPDADTLLLKSQIVAAIGNLIRAQGLTQAATARKIGLTQPDVSRLLEGRVDGFSLERLLGLLVALGQKVTIEVIEVANENNEPGPRLVFAHA
jgi:predicted XRE-type DNA-binding protein